MDKELSSASPENKLPTGKKLTTGKLAGIIFCILAAACTVVLLFISGYFSGQMKTIDKFFTSIARSDFNGYKSCLSAEIADSLTEADLEANKEWLQNLLDGEEIKTSAAFVKREKFDNGFLSGYFVYIELTIYNDDHVTTWEKPIALIREGMKWVILEY